MPIAKWTWSGTNPNKYFTQNVFASVDYPRRWVASYSGVSTDDKIIGLYDLASCDPTIAEVQKAYNTLINKGPITDFSHKVWNAICAKIYDLAWEWDIDRSDIYDIKKSLIGSPHYDDYIDYYTKNWTSYTADEIKEYVDTQWQYLMDADNITCLHLYMPGVVHASKYSRVVDCLYLLGNKYHSAVYTGDELTAKHILDLTDWINRWAELSPLWFNFTDKFKSKARNVPIILNTALPINLDYLITRHNGMVIPKWIPSIQAQVRLNALLNINLVPPHILYSIAASSPINFHTLNIKCAVTSDKYKDIIISDIYQYHAEILIRSLSPLHMSMLHNYVYGSNLTVACISEDLIAVLIRLLATHHDEIVIGTSNPIGIAFLNAAKHIGTGILWRGRPMPIMIDTEFISTGNATIDFDGRVILDNDNSISITDNQNISVNSSDNIEHSKVINITQRINAESRKAVQLVNVENVGLSDNIIGSIDKVINFKQINDVGLSSDTPELINALGKSFQHRAKISDDNAASMHLGRPATNAHVGSFKTLSSIELTFANEMSMPNVNDAISTTDLFSMGMSKALLMDVSYTIDTESVASISNIQSVGIETNYNVEVECTTNSYAGETAPMLNIYQILDVYEAILQSANEANISVNYIEDIVFSALIEKIKYGVTIADYKLNTVCEAVMHAAAFSALIAAYDINTIHNVLMEIIDSIDMSTDISISSIYTALLNAMPNINTTVDYEVLSIYSAVLTSTEDTSVSAIYTISILSNVLLASLKNKVVGVNTKVSTLAIATMASLVQNSISAEFAINTLTGALLAIRTSRELNTKYDISTLMNVAVDIATENNMEANYSVFTSYKAFITAIMDTNISAEFTINALTNALLTSIKNKIMQANLGVSTLAIATMATTNNIFVLANYLARIRQNTNIATVAYTNTTACYEVITQYYANIRDTEQLPINVMHNTKAINDAKLSTLNSKGNTSANEYIRSYSNTQLEVAPPFKVLTNIAIQTAYDSSLGITISNQVVANETVLVYTNNNLETTDSKRIISNFKIDIDMNANLELCRLELTLVTDIDDALVSNLDDITVKELEQKIIL